MEPVKVVVTCQDCGAKGQFSLSIPDVNDWGWMILNDMRGHGFELSETSAYCDSCAKKYQRGPFNSLTDKKKEV